MNELLKASLIRALWTVSEIAVVMIGTNATFLSDVNWLMVLSACCLGFIVTFLKCLATGLPEADYEEYLHMDVDEPDDADAEVFDDEE